MYDVTIVKLSRVSQLIENSIILFIKLWIFFWMWHCCFYSFKHLLKYCSRFQNDQISSSEFLVQLPRCRIELLTIYEKFKNSRSSSQILSFLSQIWPDRKDDRKRLTNIFVTSFLSNFWLKSYIGYFHTHKTAHERLWCLEINILILFFYK